MIRQNVVLVIGPVPPPYTGTEMMTQVLLRSGLGQDCRVVHLNTSRQRSVDTKGLFDTANIVWGLLHLAHLGFLVVRHRPETIVLPFAQNRAAALRDGLFVLLGAITGCRIIAVFHNSTFNVFYERCGLLWRWFVRNCMRRIDRLIVLGKSLAEQFSSIVDQSRVRVCHNGIETSDFDAAVSARVDAGEYSGCVRYLFVGHLSRAKGAVDLLTAFREAVDLYPEMHLTMIGAPIAVERNVTSSLPGSAGWDSTFAAVSGDLPDKIIAPGVVTGDDKVRLFADSDVFVLPSYSEAFPVSVLEAMAAGLPIITTTVGALPEVLEPEVNAIFVEPGDRVALTAGLLRLAQDKGLRRKMGQANARAVRQRFTLDHFAARMREIVSEVSIARAGSS